MHVDIFNLIIINNTSGQATLREAGMDENLKFVNKIKFIA